MKTKRGRNKAVKRVIEEKTGIGISKTNESKEKTRVGRPRDADERKNKRQTKNRVKTAGVKMAREREGQKTVMRVK